MLGGDRRTVGRTLVFPNLAIADGGGVLYLPIPSGVDIVNVSIGPIANACPRTTIRPVLWNRVNPDQGIQLPIGFCFAIGTTSYDYHWFGNIPLSDDYEWELIVSIKNLSGAALNFNVNATIRERI